MAQLAAGRGEAIFVFPAGWVMSPPGCRDLEGGRRAPRQLRT